jgi:hypothetical protein
MTAQHPDATTQVPTPGQPKAEKPTPPTDAPKGKSPPATNDSGSADLDVTDITPPV